MLHLTLRTSGSNEHVLETTFKLGQPGLMKEVRVVQKLSPLARMNQPPHIRMLMGIALQAKYFAFVYPASAHQFERIKEHLQVEEEVRAPSPRALEGGSGRCVVRAGLVRQGAGSRMPPCLVRSFALSHGVCVHLSTPTPARTH